MPRGCRMCLRVAAVFATAAATTTASSACADWVELADGGALEGRVVELGESIRVEGRLGSVTLPRAKVLRVTVGELSWEAYPRRAAGLADADADGHYRLGLWCREKELGREAREQFERAIAGDPGHEAAHAALGHVRVDGTWLEVDPGSGSAGKAGGWTEWVTPEEKALRAEQAHQKELEEQLRKRVLRFVLQTGNDTLAKREEAFEVLASIGASRKLPVLISVLEETNPEVRGYAVLELGRMRAPRAVPGLAKCCVADPVLEVREMAWAMLWEMEDADTSLSLARHLRDSRAEVRIRAAEALAKLPDRRVAGLLVEALDETCRAGGSRVKRGTIGGETPGGANAPKGKGAVAAGGGGSVAAEGLPLVPVQDAGARAGSGSAAEDPLEVKDRERQTILRALRAISGMDFGLRLDLWRFWLKLSKERAAGKPEGR
ncbi:MAG: HEAT repeat domain-containing protein [Planctomycetes bacterium]|nr:HEAT repeat domain-containing protein [Planctomycetota bacterium]